MIRQRETATKPAGKSYRTPDQPAHRRGPAARRRRQGIAQALYEDAVYDADGNLQTTTFTDYLVPSAAEFGTFELDHTVTPSPTNPMGVKGIGEAGRSRRRPRS